MKSAKFVFLVVIAISSCSRNRDNNTDEMFYRASEMDAADSGATYSEHSDWSGECTEDCSGHDAGYEWAEENDISDTDDCSGQSDSFNEGCVAFVEENYEESSGSYSSSDYDPTLYTNCDEVRADGEDPIDSSHPRFGDHLDADGDGVGCEPYYEE